MKTKFVRLVLALILVVTAIAADVSAASCEEWAYEDCLSYCWGRAQEGSCGFYANQLCLCMRGPADCPLCY